MSTNPFQKIDDRLNGIECMLLDLKESLDRIRPSDSFDELITITEASDLLKLSIPTLYTKVSKREIPFCKQQGSKRLYFSKQELISYIKSGRCQTEKELMANPDSLILKRKGGK